MGYQWAQRAGCPPDRDIAMSEAELTLAAEFEPASREQWLALVGKVLKGGDFEKRLVSRTADGIAIQPLYTRTDSQAGALAQRRSGQLAGAWDVRQRVVEPDPKAANTAILEDLTGGVTSILLQIDAPGQGGLSDDAETLAAALNGVLLDGCPIALDARENALDAAGSLIQIWRDRGIAEASRQGAFNYDPLGVLAKTGTLYYPAARSCEIAAKLAVDCAGMPNVTALLADGRPYHEAGASEAQELAAMLATLIAYLRACEAAGLAPGAALGRIAVGLAADADLFLTMAKLRAARRLLARVAEACGAGAAAGSLQIAATTSERMMARRDPWVNMLRTTAACAGAAFAGADTITVLPFTWALGRPDAFARRIARNTHLVLQEESSVARVTDPAHGSWYVETLTGELSSKAWALFQEIEAKGAMARALESGFIQDEIARVAEARAKDITHGRAELTGVSAFPMLGDDGVKFAPHPPADPITKGGTSVVPLAPRRLAAPFEALRDNADAHQAKTGTRPQVILAALGDLAVHATRATWMTNFLAAGGIEAILSEPLHNSADAGKAFAASGASVACLCSSDQTYGELGEATASVLKQAGARQVLLAGRPREQEAALKAAGVDTFVFAGGDAIATLTKLHETLGVQ
jgi:methylmalonyl-CoA mutase